jgi:hypothetical protein
MSKQRSRSSRARSRSRRNPRPRTAPAPQVISPEPASEPEKPEYKYVIDDLRRVIILAAAMFGLLIALSFFIR